MTLVDQQTISHDTIHMQCKLINFVILAMHIFALQTVEELPVNEPIVKSHHDAHLLHVLQDSIKHNSQHQDHSKLNKSQHGRDY